MQLWADLMMISPPAMISQMSGLGSVAPWRSARSQLLATLPADHWLCISARCIQAPLRAEKISDCPGYIIISGPVLSRSRSQLHLENSHTSVGQNLNRIRDIMEKTSGFKNSFDQKVIPSYYFAERPSSDSGLSLSDASDDDARTTSPGGADPEPLYENVSFSSSQGPESTRDKRDRDVTTGINATFPEPPLNFRDFGHHDWISDNEEDNIGEDIVTEGYHNSQDDFDNANDIITANKTSAASPGFSVRTLKKKKVKSYQQWPILSHLSLKVSRHNFVAHYRSEERREGRMIVSEVGTVRGIRHRVSQIKMGIMDSLHIGIDDRTLYKQVGQVR